MTRKLYRLQTPGTRLYIALVVATGSFTIFQSVVDLASGGTRWNWLVLAVLTLVSGSATVALPSLPATVSVSETFVFTSVILFGPSAGTVTVALDAAIISFWSYRKGQASYKIIFNIAALSLTIWTASHLFFILTRAAAGGRVGASLPLFGNPQPATISQLLGPLVVFAVIYFGLNSWIIAFAIALERRQNAFTIWRQNFLKLSLNYFGGASIAAIFVSYSKDLDYTYLAIVIPLVIVLYFTFSTSMGRVEDANRHLNELNALYMSTIETLAMAIDAKDQITHGHIRRVQKFAVGLAEHLGVVDEKMIKAIEAAALLHDMGKLAVPEYILNKPGPLTPAEFEKMKLHASVGADILSAINFPYPVVPIVRHHHEHWDGGGYPDGLKQTAIPIGARILSVVDCFDALTSDRPYRPRLSNAAAVQILNDRRGTMYDPLIVDAFVAEHERLASDISEDANSSPIGLAAIKDIAPTPDNPAQVRDSLDHINASTGEMVALYDIASELSTQSSFSEAAELTLRHVRRLIPCSVCVFFAYLSDVDELRPEYVSGEFAGHFFDLRIIRGQKLSGWVAANKQTIINSDPVLDLGEAARTMTPRLRSCLSTSISHGEVLVGVVSLYSATDRAFSDEHSRVLEAVARQVSKPMSYLPIKRAHSVGRSKLPSHAPESPLQLTPRTNAVHAGSVIVLAISTVTPHIERVLLQLVSAMRACLREGDRLQQLESRVIAYLPSTSTAQAAQIIVRIRDRISANSELQTLGVTDINLGAASAPEDGLTLEQLIASAAFRSSPGGAPPSPGTCVH